MLNDTALKKDYPDIYLGDGVYASFDGYQIWLTTPEGMSIALDCSVYNAVRAYGAKIWELNP